MEARDLPVRLVASPFESPTHFAWHLDERGPTTHLALDGELPVTVESVLVRSTGWLDPSGWEPADHAYMQSEVQATLVAWLAGLDCPVVNRVSAAIWYRPLNPLLVWLPLLRRCGLPTPETVVTDDLDVACAFGRRLEAAGLPGAVCTSLTSDVAWLVGPADWKGLAAAQRRTPVCLSEPHGRAHPACVVDQTVIWDGPPSLEEASLEPGLLRLADATALAFLEVAVAPIRCGSAVVLVDPLPRLDHFASAPRAKILDTLTGLLIPGTGVAPDVREARA